MQQVTAEIFFSTIGPQNVHPRVVAASLKDRWHVSAWEHRDTRELLGRTESDSHANQPTRFYLQEKA